MKNLFILTLAVSLSLTSCSVLKKHKSKEHTQSTTKVDAVTVSTVTATATTHSKDTNTLANVTTVQEDIDTSIHTPGTHIAGTAPLEDGRVVLPDGSTFTWNVDTGNKTISLTASTPGSSIPVTLHTKRTTTSNTTAINSHTAQSQAQESATVNATASTQVDAKTSLKTKDITTLMPPMSVIIGSVLILVCVLIIWFLRRRTPV